jgi:D-glycero-D-manno-heptose 1,7-bisphosphate phosphatase
VSRVVLLDRDGVINVDRADFVRRPEDWEPIPGSGAAIARLNDAGIPVAVCSNQSGVGRGLMTREDLCRVHEAMTRSLADAGAHLDLVAVCPHAPDVGCSCRKPAPGLLRQAMTALGVSPALCYFVGDSERDLVAARAAGVRPVLVRTGKGMMTERSLAAESLARVVCFDDLAAFVEDLLASGLQRP